MTKYTYQVEGPVYIVWLFVISTPWVFHLIGEVFV